MPLKSKFQNVAIVGINRDSAGIFSTFQSMDGIRSVLVVRETNGDLDRLNQFPDLDIIINTTRDAATAHTLRTLKLPDVQIISGLSARILFGAGGDDILDNQHGDKRRVLNSLREVAEAVYLSKNKEELFKVILTVAIKTCGADSGSIMLSDAGKRFLKIEMADGLDATIVDSTIQKIGKGIAGKVFKTKQPILINGDETGGPDSDIKRSELVSSMCAPLAIGDEVVGVVNINSKNKTRKFLPEDLHYLVELADFTAAIIKISKEYEHSSESTFLLELLNSIRDILNLSFNFDEKITLVTMKIANAFKAEICNYYLYNKRMDSFFVKASSLFSLNLLRGKTLKLNDYIAKKAIVATDTVCLSIVDKKNNLKKWYIGQPLRVNGELVGLVYLHLIVNKDDLSDETHVMHKAGGLIAKELGKYKEIESSRMQSIKYSAISEVTFDFATVSSVDDLVKIVVSNACLIMEAETCVMRLPNPFTGQLEMVSSFSLAGDKTLQIEPLDLGIATEAVKIGPYILVPDISDSPFKQYKDSAHSALSMALSHKGKFLGVISLYDKKSLDLFEYRIFSERDAEVFMNFCLQVSKALVRFSAGKS